MDSAFGSAISAVRPDGLYDAWTVWHPPAVAAGGGQAGHGDVGRGVGRSPEARADLVAESCRRRAAVEERGRADARAEAERAVHDLGEPRLEERALAGLV